LPNKKCLYDFGLREKEWIQHVGVFGRSGAGKTNAGFLISLHVKVLEKSSCNRLLKDIVLVGKRWLGETLTEL